MESTSYPYLGKKTYKNHEYVVMFTEENYGVVVMSDVQDDIDGLRFGYIGEFNEEYFEPLEKNICVRLSN